MPQRIPRTGHSNGVITVLEQSDSGLCTLLQQAGFRALPMPHGSRPLQPGLVVVRGDGTETLAEATDLARRHSVILVSGETTREAFARAATAKVAGYVTVPFAPPQLIATLTMVLARRGPAFTRREQQVADHLLQHARAPAIAEALHMSTNTARNHIKAMFVKLGVRSQQELINRLLGRPR